MTVRRTSTPSGLVESAFLKLAARRAAVSRIEAIGEDFRLVTLAGGDLEGRAWTPGDMIQIALGGWEHRAYTPCCFDPRTGTADFLGYVHGNGIGSAWLASLEVGERCFLAGPRAALDLNALRRPLLLFGDETAFSTAAALQATPSKLRDVAFVFEVASLESSRVVLERFGVAGASTLILRKEGDRHLEELENHVLGTFRAFGDTYGVFTGKASSIQRLYKALRRSGVPGKQVTNIAYWAPGRKGFSGIQR